MLSTEVKVMPWKKKPSNVNVDFECYLWYPKLTEDARDHGLNLPENQRGQFIDADGFYKSDLLISQEIRDQLKGDVLPDNGLHGNNWQDFAEEKVSGEKLYKYKAKRPHRIKAFMQTDANGNITNDGVIGAPSLLQDNDGVTTPYDTSQGVIGNWTKAKVRLLCVNKKVTRIEMVKVLDLEVFDPDEKPQDEYHGF